MLATLPSGATQSYWLAVAEDLAGHRSKARERLEPLTRSDDQLLRASALRRLEWMIRRGTERSGVPSDLLRSEARRVLSLWEEDRAYGRTGMRAASRPWVSYVLVVMNVAAFAFETSAGSTTDPLVLLKCGALWPAAVLDGQWWRLLTFLFLHAGIAHVSMNVLALLAFGRYVEAALGHIRTLVVYVLSGLTGGALYVMLAAFGGHDRLVVGASGCIMGIVGAPAAIMLRGWRAYGSQTARSQLVAIAALIALQSVLDVLVPSVGFLAHASGVVCGMTVASLMRHQVGLAVSARRAASTG